MLQVPADVRHLLCKLTPEFSFRINYNFLIMLRVSSEFLAFFSLFLQQTILTFEKSRQLIICVMEAKQPKFLTESNQSNWLQLTCELDIQGLQYAHIWFFDSLAGFATDNYRILRIRWSCRRTNKQEIQIISRTKITCTSTLLSWLNIFVSFSRIVEH